MAAAPAAPLLPLPTMRSDLIGPVDGANLEGGGLADAQATRIHDGEAGLVNQVADTPEQLPDLILLTARQAARFCRGEAILFSPNSPHVRSRVW